ncbi:MAG: thioredoxin family protein [Verrucomicrobiota bacterium]|nr:thioredoxin family protein [Verrucomicrobiota bacterium]
MSPVRATTSMDGRPVSPHQGSKNKNIIQTQGDALGSRVVAPSARNGSVVPWYRPNTYVGASESRNASVTRQRFRHLPSAFRLLPSAFRLLPFFLCLCLLPILEATPPVQTPPTETKATALPPIFSETADGFAQIQEAMDIASKDGRRVLLLMGANWCPWCHKLNKLIQTDTTIQKRMADNFVLVLINIDKGKNEAVSTRFGNPRQFGLPVLLVLNAGGGLLTVQETGALEEGDHHSPVKVLAFLDRWAVRRAPPKASLTMKFDLISIFVSDLPKMVEFYRTVLGMETAWDGKRPYAEFKHEGMRVSMYARSELPTLLGQAPGYPPGTGLNGTFSLSVEVPRFADVDVEYARMVAAGARSVYPARLEPWGIRSAMIADPEGNLIEIASHDKGSQ